MHTTELLIVGVDNLPDNADVDWIVPTGLAWQYELRNNWPWYAVPGGGYTYSWEPQGVQLIFDKVMDYDTIMTYATAIVAHLIQRGYKAELIAIDTSSGTPIAF